MGTLENEILNSDVIALDTETTGTYWPRDKAFMLSLSTRWSDYYWDLRQEPKILGHLQGLLLRKPRLVIAAHNASFDYKMCYSAGLATRMESWACTVVRACLIDEHESSHFPWSVGRGDYSLDHLSRKYLGARKSEEFYERARQWFGKPKMSKNAIMSRIAELPSDVVGQYAMVDTRLCLDLWHWQQEEITRQGLHDIVAFEKKLFPVLLKSEMQGIDVDTDEAERAQPKLTTIIDQKQKELNQIAGDEINVNSTPQIRKLLEPRETDDGWIACDGTPLETTKSGNPSISGDTLRKIQHPAVPYIVEIRSLIKTRDTFLGGHILGHAVDGKVYPNINQAKGEDGGTGTGRLSYTKPAMQQIPSRNKSVAEIVKPCFLPPEGKVWLETDLASFEVRMFAHLVAAYNDSLVEAYKKNPEMDFHQWVADMTGLVRNAEYTGQPNAKQLNLSMIFNQGKGSTAEKMGMPWEWDEFTQKGKVIRYKKAGPEAQRVIGNYHRRVQGVQELADRAKMVAEAQGFIRTKMGRRLRFPRGYKSYKASGLLIQATSADVNKRNWLVIDEVLGDAGHLILNTHDSYSMAVPENWKPYFKSVKAAIEDTSDLGLRAPLILDLDGAGRNWWSAKNGELK